VASSNFVRVRCVVDINDCANCSIDLLSFSANDWWVPKYGHVKLNGEVVWKSAWLNGSYAAVILRGVNVMTVNLFNCTLQAPSRQFDTMAYAAGGTWVADHLQEIANGTVIVAVTADEPTNFLSDALPTLTALGVNVTDLQWRGAFAFIAQKGFPAKTVYRKAATELEAFNDQPNIVATVSGRLVLLVMQ